ncbi:MAG: class I SAM-dependent methyltransferase [Pigmentiphaga sp.]|uniref:SAM-dependent methyltransferase n=1 Tax=Pigmentiphaga sp. TaxID=1977564 RepID=UPI0029A0A109|nr:class I SAM-dependent methyltransferase [Pigmentiphaga sp.]MDX3906855.1 class I SAM-dependent methyltransferase [Pigmentiphaga sp.]
MLYRRWIMTCAAALAACLSPAQASERPRLDVPFITTPPAVVERMLELGQVDKDDYLIDLGSGDGRISIAAARTRGARSLGVDLDPARVAEATANARRAGVADRLEFRQQDLFDTDLSAATVLTMYLFPEINMRLRPRLLETLAPGTRIVSHAFHMEDWIPDRHDVVQGRDIFQWIVPAPVAGLWQVETPRGDRLVLRLWQQFQRIQGVAVLPGEHSIPLMEASLEGDRIRFQLHTADGVRRFSGHVNGREMRSDTPETPWSASRYD